MKQIGRFGSFVIRLVGVITLLGVGVSSGIAETSAFPVSKTGWRRMLHKSEISEGAFRLRLHIRLETRVRYSTVGGKRTSDGESRVAVVTNVSDSPLMFSSYGQRNGAHGPFYFVEELKDKVWTPTAACFCGTGLSEQVLKPGQTTAFWLDHPRAEGNKRLERILIVFRDASRASGKPLAVKRSLEVLGETR